MDYIVEPTRFLQDKSGNKYREKVDDLNAECWSVYQMEDDEEAPCLLLADFEFRNLAFKFRDMMENDEEE